MHDQSHGHALQHACAKVEHNRTEPLGDACEVQWTWQRRRIARAGCLLLLSFCFLTVSISGVAAAAFFLVIPRLQHSIIIIQEPFKHRPRPLSSRQFIWTLKTARHCLTVLPSWPRKPSLVHQQPCVYRRRLLQLYWHTCRRTKKKKIPTLIVQAWCGLLAATVMATIYWKVPHPPAGKS